MHSLEVIVKKNDEAAAKAAKSAKPFSLTLDIQQSAIIRFMGLGQRSWMTITAEEKAEYAQLQFKIADAVVEAFLKEVAREDK